MFLRGTDRCSMFSRTSLRGEYQGLSESAVTERERKRATFREKVFLKTKMPAGRMSAYDESMYVSACERTS